MHAPLPYRLLAPITLSILFGLLLAACGTVIPTATPTLPPSQTPLPTLTPTPLPTPTSTPLPPLAVLLAGPESDVTLANTLQTTLNEQVTGAGMRWQVRQRLNPEDLGAGLQLVIALPPDPGLADLAAASPQTQFLAVGISGLEPAPNLTVLGAQGERFDQHGFIAGVMAAMITPDWRVGVISIGDTVQGRSARTGFLNGVIYFCGLCRPAYPPFYEYPLYFELATGANTAEWQAAADYMIDRGVTTAYIYPGAGDSAMLEKLAGANVKMIASGIPSDALRPHWVASLGTDPMATLLAILPDVINGNSAGNITLPLQLSQVNADLFSPGKQDYIAETLGDLLAGYIDTGVDLATGENR
ncbi:MAG: hypothetical protein JW726_15480 [Anaerolineales bacterium]|nr:hypothetical protein [Anaerolineales bacterium]